MRRRNISEHEIEFGGLSDFATGSYTSKVCKPGLTYIDNMAQRDRTSEFMSVVKNKEERDTHRVRLKENVLPSKKSRFFKGMDDFSNFIQAATGIGKEINNTFKKLEKLSLLAKKRSLFDDKPVEIEELTYIIREDIQHLNKQIAQLQMSKNKNSTHGKHMLSHSKIVVVSLQSKLASMSNDFKHVLEVRTENLKHEKSRREQFTENTCVSAATLPASALSEHRGSVLLSDDRAHSSKGDFTINMGNDPTHFQQQVQLLDQQDTYIQGRADAMQNIEATIVELGSIFQQLADMVKQQEDIVKRIDSNVEDAQLNIEAAHTEILKYFSSVTSNRWLMIKIFAVLIVFFIVFVVFVA